MLRNFIPRLYQQTIFSTCSSYNTLVVLPTGLGKTAISLLMAAHRIKNYPESKILILAPTKPLLDQHLKTFAEHLDIDVNLLFVLSGTVSPEKRKTLWDSGKIFFATPQTIDNDLISGKISMQDVSLLCIDECHRSVGDYSYVHIAKKYNDTSFHPRILALTASPGSDLEKINEVIDNLGIEKIEMRTDEDEEVKPYVQSVNVEYIGLDFPNEFRIVHENLKLSLRKKLEEIKEHGYINNTTDVGKRDILRLQGVLQSQIAQGDRSFELMKSVSLAAEALKVEHAIELVETQGPHSVEKYLEDLFEKAKSTKTKATQNIARDPYVHRAYIKSKEFSETMSHPKLQKIKSILEEELASMREDSRIIIFTQYRETARKIKEFVDLKDARIKLFFGQTSKGQKGMTQKEQIKAIDDFRKGEHNILVMTSVGEEGLDIPQVDLVIFYEPIPSAIRTVQRRGRTGRKREGKVIVLYTKGTRDEAYRWSAHHKEKRMYKNIEKVIKDLELNTARKQSNQNLKNYIESKKVEGYKIFADSRENNSHIIREMSNMGFLIELSRLDAGDYILSKEIGIEFKTVKDFVDSIVDGRLLEQLKKLKEHYQKPLLVVQGEEDIFSIRNVHYKAILGMLSTIALNYRIPILQTKNPRETVLLFQTIVEKCQKEGANYYSPHSRKGNSLKETQEYFISALPNVGMSLAKKLLNDFKSVKNIANASEAELQRIDLLGKKKARQIRDVFDLEYDENS